MEEPVMLVHIVVWKYKAETDEEARDQHVAKLKALAEVIPDIEVFYVGRDIVHLDRSYDTGLTSIFKNREAFDAYTVHPSHEEVALLGRRIAEHVVSVDFLAG